MKRRILTNSVIISVIIIVLLINLIWIACAQSFNPPGNPTPVPKHPSSGGGGGYSSYTPPAINYPIIVAVKNSNGVVIGNVTTLSLTQIVFLVSQTLTVNGQPINVTMSGDLGSAPSNPGMDIIGEPTNSSDLPGYLTIGQILACINFTSLNGGWNVDHGTDQITLTVPQALIGSANVSQNVLVRFDGTVYELLMTSVSGPDSNGNYTFTATSPNEGFSGFSEYTLGLATPAAPTPTATPVPTPIVTSVPTPMTQPDQAPVNELTIILSIILVAVIVVVAFIGYFQIIRPR